MLSPFDDYPIHQVSQPLARPATSDRNAYDRYWFGGVAGDGSLMFEAAFGRYPNLGVVDGHLSLVVDGVQDSFHASAAAPADPTVTVAGPFRLEILEPMRRLRITVGDEGNDTGIRAEVEWRSKVGALLEDHTVMEDAGTVIVDMDRFVQFGAWTGWIEVDGRRTELPTGGGGVVGTRDRSWGVRPVGEKPVGRPGALPSVAWLWAPVHFADECRSLGYFQHPGGRVWRGDGFRIPLVDPVAATTAPDDPGVVRLTPAGQRITFVPGSRFVAGAELDAATDDDDSGAVETLALAPILRFHMRGLGYSSPDWGHGVWHGEVAVGRDSWRLDEVDPGDPYMQHVHHAVRARVGDREGVGVLEQILFGPHTQFGFSDFLDGAPT